MNQAESVLEVARAKVAMRSQQILYRLRFLGHRIEPYAATAAV
jgi:hypothetical protein